MPYRILAALLSCAVLLVPVLRAETIEPQVYFFWSATCPYSKAARTFLTGAQAKDPQLRIRDFEMDESVANARLLGRLYDKIGLPEFRVAPVVVVGHHVVIGYIDDDTTGTEILGHVAECRKTGCKDQLRDLLEEKHFEQVAATPPRVRVVCERNPGRTVR
jgi:glutaredoxin